MAIVPFAVVSFDSIVFHKIRSIMVEQNGPYSNAQY
jgi:hypothetical protein